MTTKLIVNKFRTRPAAAPSGALGQITPKQIQVTPEQAAQMKAASMQSQVPPQAAFPQPAAPQARKTIGDDAFFPVPEDGFGGQSFATARGAKPAPSAAPTPAPNPAAEIAAIKSEGLTGRQLRMARKLAQKHELPATSDFDAVRLLRNAGIDPFQTNSILELVSNTAQSTALVPAQSRDLALTKGPQLPQTVQPIPSVEDRVAEAHIAEVRRIQQEIVARRRKKSILLFSRMGVFVFLPTLLAGIYFYDIATPFYSTKTEFVIQSAEPSSGGGGLSSLMKASPLANATDSITVQGYLQSQDAMERLNADNGFRAHYSDPKIDALQRLSPTASNTSAYKTYRRNVKISFDPTEGIIKMEVIAADPNVAVEISKSLIKYAEEQVDQMTVRVRNDQMAGAQESYLEAEKALAAANEKVVALQEKNKILSSELEVGLISSQIGQLDGQLTQDRLSLAQMQSNASPNQSRMEPLKRRIATVEEQIAVLRAKLTEDGQNGQSIARVQSELLVAQADVETRRVLLGQSLQAKEAARNNANRQTRYLSMSVNPIAADEPAYPRAFENTLVVALIFAGLYLMLSMTAAILKEQITA